MSNLKDAKQLAKLMVEIGNIANIPTKAIITSMDQPLGKTVGNALEIKEVISFFISR